MTSLLALVAAAAVVGVPAARAEQRPQVVVDESAAQEDKAATEKEKEKADADRVEKATKTIADASQFGRRIEATMGRISQFTEYIPSADGFLSDQIAYVRVGTEVVQPDGTVEVSTTYYSGLAQLGFVVSVKKDGVETVKQVFEYQPGSIDVKPGDSRPVPAPSSSAAGKKPHTIDPKADGSLGRASGNHPDASPAAIADTEKTPRKETIVGDKVELAGGGTRTEFNAIKAPDGSVFKPFEEVKPDAPELPFRSGYDLKRPSFGDAWLRITGYLDKEGKLEAVLGTVLKDGLETVLTTKEFKPGALGGLKPGDTRPFDSSGGKNPSTWNPKPPSGSGSGAKSGSPQSSGSAPQNGSGPANEGRPKSEPAPDDKGGDSPSSDTPGQTTPSSSDGGQYVFLGQGPKRENEDGSTSQNTLYQRTSDGVYVQTITKTQQDGTQSEEQHCIKDSEEVDCGSLTDEPTCGSSCAHLGVFLWLFGCDATDCGTPPVAEPDRHCDSSAGGRDTTESAGGKGQGSSKYSTDKIVAPHCPAGQRTGGPIDHGNPYDENAPEPFDGQFTDPRDDGVTDPADPGEGEGGPAPFAILDTEEGPDLGNELLDPVDPWTDDSAPSGDGQPTTGDAERRIP